MASSTGVNLAISGLASGMDWQTVVSQLANAERAPETQWQATQSKINSRNANFTTIKNNLTTLQSDVDALKDPTLYDSRTAQSSNSVVATASAATGATAGTFTFKITQLATASQLVGTSNIAQALCPNGTPPTTPSDITLGTAGFATPITAGSFTLNGQTINVSTAESLQDVFDEIDTKTNHTVAASYDSSSDAITLTSTNQQPIVLGSPTDTSNFLQVAQLYNMNSQTGTDGNYSISSNAALGSVLLTASLGDADLKTAIHGDGTGQGSFSINGVTITYDTNTDSLQDVLNRINNSTAGVTASYDVQNKRFTLTNTATGDLGMVLQDGANSNFLAATGLAGGTLAQGANLLYTLNGGTQTLISQSNTITAASSGITGLSVTALDTGSTTVTVATDTGKITSALQSFVKDYNAVQTYIANQSATSTDSSGNVTAGLLTGDQTASEISSSLRSLSFSEVSVTGLPGFLNQLADLGIKTSGYNNTITLDTDALTTALANNSGNVKTLLSDPTNGLAARLDSYLTDTIGDDGTLTNHQATLTQQSNAINDQIATLEKSIAAESARWTSEFQNMEQVQSQTNQILSYLSQQISSGSL